MHVQTSPIPLYLQKFILFWQRMISVTKTRKQSLPSQSTTHHQLCLAQHYNQEQQLTLKESYYQPRLIICSGTLQVPRSNNEITKVPSIGKSQKYSRRRPLDGLIQKSQVPILGLQRPTDFIPLQLQILTNDALGPSHIL